MDNHKLTNIQNNAPPDGEVLHDSVTAELIVEFAKLNERERSLENCNFEVSWTLTAKISKELGIIRRSIQNSIAKAKEIVDSLKSQLARIADAYYQRKLEIWTKTLESAVHTLAKISASFARSLQATLRTPLLLDGPELSGYKHRLR